MPNCRTSTWNRKRPGTCSRLGFSMRRWRTLASTLGSLRESFDEDVGSMEHHGVRAWYIITPWNVDFPLPRCDFITVWRQRDVASAGDSILQFPQYRLQIARHSTQQYIWYIFSSTLIILFLTVNYRYRRLSSRHSIRSHSLRDSKRVSQSCDRATSWWRAIAYKMWYFTVTYIFTVQLFFRIIKHFSFPLGFFPFSSPQTKSWNAFRYVEGRRERSSCRRWFT